MSDPEFDTDNPEWTKEDFARAKRGADIPDFIRDAFPKSKGGRPKGATKEIVTLRIDKDVVAKLRASGPGWQSRVNAMLRKAVG
jgi:uncharacterized protein (DUF4415 family)